MKKLIIFILLIPIISSAQDFYKVKTVSDSAILQLEDGTKIKLAGIVIGKGEQAKAVQFIKSATKDQDINLKYQSIGINRHGHQTAHIYSSSGQWLQGKLLEQGLAFVYALSDEILLKEMLVIEKKAQKTKNGIWSSREHRIISDLQAKENIWYYRNKFKIIEGKVFAVKKLSDKVFINFGEDWKTDFTTMIRKENLKNFDNLDFESITGKKVQVRGWVESYNGPLIEIYNKGHLVF